MGEGESELSNSNRNLSLLKTETCSEGQGNSDFQNEEVFEIQAEFNVRPKRELQSVTGWSPFASPPNSCER